MSKRNKPKIQNERNKQRVWPAFGRRTFKPITKRLDKDKGSEPAEEPVEEHDYTEWTNSTESIRLTQRSDQMMKHQHQQRHHRHQRHQHYWKKKTGKPLMLLPHRTKRGGSQRRQAFSKAPVNQPIWQSTSLSQYDNDPNYRVKKQSSEFHRFSVEGLKTFRDEIKKPREETQLARISLDNTSWETEGSGSDLSDGNNLIN